MLIRSSLLLDICTKIVLKYTDIGENVSTYFIGLSLGDFNTFQLHNLLFEDLFILTTLTSLPLT